MPITPDSTIRADDFINESQKNVTPSADANRVTKLESNQKLHPYFVSLGKQLICGETINGATTPVPVYQNKTDNELYACDGNDLTRLKFIGFVTTNGTNGNPARFQGAGVVGGFTGLQEGEKYYVQDAVGTIGATPGTYEVLVGVAISETELLIQKGRRITSGSAAISDAGTTDTIQTIVVTSGFRPSFIRATAIVRSTDEIDTMATGTWQNGTYQSITAAADDLDANFTTQNSYLIYLIPGGQDVQWRITVTSVTDTGFTLSIQQKTANPTSFVLMWEAEGDL
jgi:hypothetical protein